MTDKEYLVYLVECLEAKNKRRERENEIINGQIPMPERDIEGIYWTHPYKDNS